MEEIIEGSRQLRDLGFGDRPGRGELRRQKHAPAGTKTGRRHGTIIAEDGLTVLSLSRVDPTATLLGAYALREVRTPTTRSSSTHAGWDEGPPSCCSRTPTWTWLTFCQSRKRVKNTKSELFHTFPVHPKPKTLCLWTRSYLWANWEKPLQTINLEKRMVNAVIEKPRKYFVIENTAPGTPVFDKEANWLGIVVYKMDRVDRAAS